MIMIMKVDIDASKKETQITVTLIRQAVESPGEENGARFKIKPKLC